MASLGELKERIREEASSNPEKFFPTDVLREKGFERRECENCGRIFWSLEERDVCGEPECSGGYTFINDPPTDRELSYVEAWQVFRDFMVDRGYEAIDRYPVVARWRDDVEFVGGSIYNFQPYVVSGEAEPPADELIVPQPSLRFNDVDNVGVTGRHYVLHNHIGQTCFKRENYDQDRYFRDMFEFAVKGLGIPREKLVLHEDAWGGGGNLGASIEFFVDGLELFNQVYMFYEVTEDGYRDLDLKVLDMGMGHERITWITHGSETSYECVMPETLEKMKERTGLEVDQEVWEEFLPYSGELNVDEVEDIEEKWSEIAEQLGKDKDDLKDAIRPVADLYSVAEHARALLFALNDGKIPGSAGGGHNLRVVFRRAQDFIEKHDWDLDLVEVARWNAEELEPVFPKLLENFEDTAKILRVEESKYRESRRQAEKKLQQVENPGLEKMIELYESHGVSPEMMREKGLEVPEDFYSRLETSREKQKEQQRFDTTGLEETEKLYYSNREAFKEEMEFKASVVDVQGDWIVLDSTLFYPEGGGQASDRGKLEGCEVVNVQKQSGVVFHKAPDLDVEKGEEVRGSVDAGRRKRLTQHHSATHAVNAAAREVLGNHIYQAGASKKPGKARLDVTHYEKPGEEEIREIERRVREIIDEDRPINVFEMQKSQAEQEYGFRIYQGGAPPGNTIRLVEIEGVDVEACGGTHLSSTSEIESFVLDRVTRVQDGVVRLEFKAGEAAQNRLRQAEKRVKKASDLLDAEQNGFQEAERELASIFSVEPGKIVDTVERFQQELKEFNSRAEKLAEFTGGQFERKGLARNGLVQRAEELFQKRKEAKKQVEGLESGIEEEVRDRLPQDSIEVPTEKIGLLIGVAKKLSNQEQTTVVLKGENGAVAASNSGEAVEALESEGFEDVQGDGSFAKAFQ